MPWPEFDSPLAIAAREVSGPTHNWGQIETLAVWIVQTDATGDVIGAAFGIGAPTITAATANTPETWRLPLQQSAPTAFGTAAGRKFQLAPGRAKAFATAIRSGDAVLEGWFYQEADLILT